MGFPSGPIQSTLTPMVTQGHARYPMASVAPLTHAVLCFSPDLPMQILKPATFTDTTHYPLLLVV